VLGGIQVEDSGFREAAVEKLTDQALLAEVAVESESQPVRYAAVKKLKDQTVLAKVAMQDEDPFVRNSAVEKLTDQAVLAEVARLAKLTDENTSPVVRANAISKLKNSDPLLKAISIWGEGSNTIAVGGGDSRDARVCIARMKLATQEPRIKSLFPRLQCAAYASETIQYYSRLDLPSPNPVKVSGERVTIKLQQDGKTLAEASWSAVFEISTKSLEFNSAVISGADLMKKLLRLSAFTPEDLADLAHSSIPEVRSGAVANITDQALLGKVAVEDQDSDVCKAAQKRLKELQKK